MFNVPAKEFVSAGLPLSGRNTKTLWSASYGPVFQKQFITNVDVVSDILPFACCIRQWPLRDTDIVFDIPHSVFNKDNSVDCLCCFFMVFLKGSTVLLCRLLATNNRCICQWGSVMTWYCKLIELQMCPHVHVKASVSLFWMCTSH